MVLTLLLLPGFCGTKEKVATVASSAPTKGLGHCLVVFSSCWASGVSFSPFFLHLVDEELSFVLSPRTLRTHV